MKSLLLMVCVLLVASVAGAQVCTVPDVTGLDAGAAHSALITAGYVQGADVVQYSETVSVGVVISQNVAAGTEHPCGGAVGLVVSQGSVTEAGQALFHMVWGYVLTAYMVGVGAGLLFKVVNRS